MSDLDDAEDDDDHQPRHSYAAAPAFAGAAASEDEDELDDDDDVDEMDDEDDALETPMVTAAVAVAAPQIPQKEPRASSPMDEDDDDHDDDSDDNLHPHDNDDDEDDVSEDSDDDSVPIPKIGMKEPRGKPEAMAVALAAARKQAAREQLQAEAASAGGSPTAATAVQGTATAWSPRDDEDDDAMPDHSPPKAAAASKKKRKSPSSPSKKSSASSAATGNKKKKTSSTSSPSSKKSSSKKKSSSSSMSAAGVSSSGSSSHRAAAAIESSNPNRSELLLHEPTVPITNAEYENLQLLMIQFCRVPLLAEFSRPVALLHPELASSYAKIVKRPVDLGHVCRGIRRRSYQNTRDVRLDMWRVFGNCVNFHSHPNNKEAVPSFVSIALHLREYFNALWQEYMLPSDNVMPSSSSSGHSHQNSAQLALVHRRAFNNRNEDRTKRLESSGVLIMSKKFMTKVSNLINNFLENNGCIDALDQDEILSRQAGEAEPAIQDVITNLKGYRDDLIRMSTGDEEYNVEGFVSSLRRCYTHDSNGDAILEDNPALRNRIANRLDRLIGKITVPLHEANSRGVTQSSIWGNIATTIWARESSKKAYWPALCLGILPPADQREGWHSCVTERNETRLPEKLRIQLAGAKKKCEAAQKRQGLSYFLVEFLGTHEFIWVRETDIVEKFDIKEDPNKQATKNKRRASRSAISSVTGSKTYTTALEECEWATEEFEQVLQEAFDYDDVEVDGEDDGEFMSYSYSLLNQSDDEADQEGDEHGYKYDESQMSASDVDEATWLIEHDGKIDTSTLGRKNAKKRTQELKKKAAAVKEQKKEAIEKKEKKDKKEKKSKKEAKKEKKKTVESKTRERDDMKEQKEHQKEQRELERRRKKRSREREKALAREAKKQKRRPTMPLSVDPETENNCLDSDKRARSTAIVKAYVTRMANAEDYKSLALGGVLTIPAAMVDSNGLLGLTLAFRAAAGELDMPDGTVGAAAAATDTNYNASKKLKPWETIDCDRPRTHQERTERLEKKMKLLEKEVERVRANVKRRRDLAAQAIEQRSEIESKIVEDDLLARVNHFKKKKKAPLSKVGSGAVFEDSLPDLPAEEEGTAANDTELPDDGDEEGTAANEAELPDDGDEEGEGEEEDSMEIDNGSARETLEQNDGQEVGAVE